uniref:Uncharacterized protein n=1 Tax=Tetraselmis sp. GSL018 TaxID=582737 RepID=A0A061RAH1_9CHLO
MATIWSRAISEHDSDVSVLNASGHHPMGESSPDTPRSPRTPRARGAPRSEVPSPRQWWPGRGQVSARSSPRSAGSNQTDGGFSPPPPSVASSALQQEWRASILEDLRTAEGAAASSSMVNAVLQDEGPLQANDHAPRSDPSADEAVQPPRGAPSAGDQGRAERWAAP